LERLFTRKSSIWAFASNVSQFLKRN